MVELRESFGRYALMGECLRGGAGGRLSQGFAARINQAIDGEPVPAVAGVTRRARPAWLRPFAGVAVAAGVAAVAIVALQQRAIAPSLREGVAASATVGAGADQAAAGAPQRAALMEAGGGLTGVRSAAPPFVTLVRNTQPESQREQLSYTTPGASSEAPAGSPGARLTNYVFVHSNYSWGLGHSNFIDLLADGEAPDPGSAAAMGAGAAETAAGADVRGGQGSAAVPARNSRRDP